MVVRQAQKPVPTWGEFGGDEAWGREAHRGLVQSPSTEERATVARVAASNGLHSQEKIVVELSKPPRASEVQVVDASNAFSATTLIGGGV